VKVRLLSNEPETPTTRRIRVALDGAPFSYRAGQAAALASENAPPTPYSIASAPSETARHGWLEFLIKVDGSSRFGAIVDALAPGARLELAGPAGGFTLDRANGEPPILFVAGGTGIAPMRSMIREAIASRPSEKLALVYSSRTPEEFGYLKELKDLADQGRLTLTLTLTGDAQDWTHARGRTGIAHLAELVAPDTMVFICGPPAMVTDVPVALESLGVARARVITESW
jgi:ferredoxin-NADP reductase